MALLMSDMPVRPCPDARANNSHSGRVRRSLEYATFGRIRFFGENLQCIEKLIALADEKAACG